MELATSIRRGTPEQVTAEVPPDGRQLALARALKTRLRQLERSVGECRRLAAALIGELETDTLREGDHEQAEAENRRDA